MWNKLKDVEKDDVLALMGLQSRRSAMDALLPALGLFGLGVLVGAGVGLLLAPKSGAELRGDLKERLTPPKEPGPVVMPPGGGPIERAKPA